MTSSKSSPSLSFSRANAGHTTTHVFSTRVPEVSNCPVTTLACFWQWQERREWVNHNARTHALPHFVAASLSLSLIALPMSDVTSAEAVWLKSLPSVQRSGRKVAGKLPVTAAACKKMCHMNKACFSNFCHANVTAVKSAEKVAGKQPPDFTISIWQALFVLLAQWVLDHTSVVYSFMQLVPFWRAKAFLSLLLVFLHRDNSYGLCCAFRLPDPCIIRAWCMATTLFSCKVVCLRKPAGRSLSCTRIVLKSNNFYGVKKWILLISQHRLLVKLGSLNEAADRVAVDGVLFPL